jgi:hypothetical protein
MTQIIGHQFAGGADPTAAGDYPGGAGMPRREDFGFTVGASSSRPDGDHCRGATGTPDAVQPPPASRPENFSVFTLSPSAALQTGRGTARDARSGLRPAAVTAPVSIVISADTAALLAVLAAERGETPGNAVARLVVAEIESKGGIAHV